jgi:hypothetical protein
MGSGRGRRHHMRHEQQRERELELEAAADMHAGLTRAYWKAPPGSATYLAARALLPDVEHRLAVLGWQPPSLPEDALSRPPSPS